jgi:hypothetical protein
VTDRNDGFVRHEVPAFYEAVARFGPRLALAKLAATEVSARSTTAAPIFLAVFQASWQLILRNDDSEGDLNDECVTRAVHIHLAAGSHEMVLPMRSYVRALLLFALLFVVGHAARLAFVPDAIPIAEGEQSSWRVLMAFVLKAKNMGLYGEVIALLFGFGWLLRSLMGTVEKR